MNRRIIVSSQNRRGIVPLRIQPQNRLNVSARIQPVRNTNVQPLRNTNIPARRNNVSIPVRISAHINLPSDPLYHFYHLWVGGPWKRIAEEHFQFLMQSGLLNSLAGFYIGLVGPEALREEAKTWISSLTMHCTVIVEAESGFEQVTLNKLHEFSKEHNGLVFYAHNKGSFNVNALDESWRRSMSICNIREWRKAVSHFDKADAVGCHWLTKQKHPTMVGIPFFGGNFWWARLSILKQLSCPKNESRYDAESWIGQYPNLRTYDLLPGWPGQRIFRK